MKALSALVAAVGIMAFAGAASACPYMSKEAKKPQVTADGGTLLPKPKTGS